MQPATYRSSSSYADRIPCGILSLNPATFREVEEDMDATGQGALTVVLAALRPGSAHCPAAIFCPTPRHRGFLGLAVDCVLARGVLPWVPRSFPPRAPPSRRGRLCTVGFAQAPKFLMIVGFVPLLGWDCRRWWR